VRRSSLQLPPLVKKHSHQCFLGGWFGLDRLLAGILTVLWLLLSALPMIFLDLLASALAPVYRLIARRDRQRLESNVHRIYGLPPQSHFARMFCRQVFREQLAIALETMRVIRFPGLARIIGFEELKAQVAAAESAGRGHIMITAHLGSWELCAYYAQKAAARPLHVLAKPAKRRFLTRFLGVLRARMEVHVLWTDRKTLVRDMLGALKKGESLGFVMDQKPEGRQGPKVPFLGIPTEFVTGPAAMTIRSGCPVIAIFCVREGRGQYRLLTRTLLTADHGEKDETAITAKFADAITSAIRAYPEQWTWSYKRWRFS